MGFTNTDPLMIKFYIEWLYQIYGVKKTDLILRVSVNANHAHRVQKIVRYWSSITGVSSTQFTKTSLIKATSKKIYPNLEEHQGTLRVKVRRGTELRRRVLGSIAALTIR